MSLFTTLFLQQHLMWFRNTKKYGTLQCILNLSELLIISKRLRKRFPISWVGRYKATVNVLYTIFLILDWYYKCTVWAIKQTNLKPHPIWTENVIWCHQTNHGCNLKIVTLKRFNGRFHDLTISTLMKTHTFILMYPLNSLLSPHNEMSRLRK